MQETEKNQEKGANRYVVPQRSSRGRKGGGELQRHFYQKKGQTVM